jgi:hypothetical protein
MAPLGSWWTSELGRRRNADQVENDEDGREKYTHYIKYK